MKFLLLIIFAVFSVAKFVNAECDEKSLKALHKCYEDFTKDKDKISFIVTKKFCKDFEEHQNCIKESAKSCKSLSKEELAKIFGTMPEEVSTVLFSEHSFRYICSHNYTATEEEQKCLASFSDQPFDCKYPKSCKELDKYIKCFNDALTKKCKNEHLSQGYADAVSIAFNKTYTCK